MALIKNNAQKMASDDIGLGVNTDLYLQECIAISNLNWKESKKKLDSMTVKELNNFIQATEQLNLNKAGTVTFRLSVREYAQLKNKVSNQDVNQTGWLELMLSKP